MGGKSLGLDRGERPLEPLFLTFESLGSGQSQGFICKVARKGS